LLSSSLLSLAATTSASSSGEEKSTTSTNGSSKSNDYYTKLEEWLISKGGQCDGVTISTTRIPPNNEDDEHDDNDDDDNNDNDAAVVHDDFTSRRRQQYVRGLVAARDVIDGDILLTVPLETACLSTFHHPGENCCSSCSTEEEKNDDAGSAQAQAPAWTASLPKKIQLAIRVIIEWSRRTTAATTTIDDDGNSQSNLPSSQSSCSRCWAPFLNSWPELVPNLPENLPEKDLVRYAQCETFIADTREYNTWLEQQYNTTSELWRSHHDPQSSSSSTTPQPQPSSTNNNFCSMEMFQKAVQLVGSRSVRLSSKRSVCVPILDMANHCSMPSARYVLHNQQDDDDDDANNNTNNNSNSNNNDDDATTTIQLVATRAIKAGDEVTISYGKHTNRQMAGCYGFIPTTFTSNPHDYELVSLLEILYAAIDGGVLTIDDKAAGGEGKGESGDHLLFSVVDQVAEFGVPITNLRLLPFGRLDSNLWLALRIAMAILRRYDKKTDGNSNNNNNDDNDDDINTIAYILEAIEMDEADEDDLWESDINVEAVIKRATVLHGALIILEQRMGRGGSSSSTTLEEDERILQDVPIRLGNNSTRLLVELRLERKKLVRSLSNQMKVVLAEEPDGLLRAVSTLISK
jgi:hypothetical protein